MTIHTPDLTPLTAEESRDTHGGLLAPPPETTIGFVGAVVRWFLAL